MHLKPLKRLSVHLKIDTEGSEWEELEWLLQSVEDMDKIRSFDMEVHLGWLSASSSRQRRELTSQQRISREPLKAGSKHLEKPFSWLFGHSSHYSIVILMLFKAS